MIVKDLIKQLQQFAPDCLVACTWEGITRDIEVYQAADQSVLIDGDKGRYKEQFQDGGKRVQL